MGNAGFLSSTVHPHVQACLNACVFPGSSDQGCAALHEDDTADDCVAGSHSHDDDAK